MTQLRFGILGLSEGNGHPYSWSAIFNGYDPAVMASCPFPAIPDYLSRQSFPADAIAGAAVTHIWAQDRAISDHVAAASRIAHVVDDPCAMIGHIDGLLLARDDAETHDDLAAPFLEAGLPVYIDKPLALSVAEAERIYARQSRPGQVFTCSALAYAEELRLSPEDLAALGRLRYVEATTVKYWDTYSVHVIEPLLALVAGEGGVARMSASGADVRHLDVTWNSGLNGRITALGKSGGGISIRLHGEKGWRELVFKDSFTAFRSALQHFTDIVAGRRPPQSAAPVLDVVRMIEAGRTLA